MNKELREALADGKVVGSPASPLDSGDFVRQIDMGRTVGNLPANAGGGATSMMTVITDNTGSLVNTFPGPLRY